MAATTQQRIAGVGTRLTFNVPAGLDQAAEDAAWRALVDAYGTTAGGTVPTQNELAFLCELALCVDLIHNPARLGWSNGTATVSGRTVPMQVGTSLPAGVFTVGGHATPAVSAAWTPTPSDPAASLAELALEKERQEWALALVNVAREIVTDAASRVVVPAQPPAGFLEVLAVGAVIVLAVAFDAYCDHVHDVETLKADADVRIARARFAAASQDYVNRLAQFNATGVMPALSANETAAAAERTQRATSEWGGFWQPIAQAAAGGTKVLFAAAAVAVLLAAMKR